LTDPRDAFGLLRSFLAHRAHLAAVLGRVTADLAHRAAVHDLSKLQDDEFEGYCRINAGVRGGAAFGSDEYRALMARERPVIDAHFKRNRHHPERPRLLGLAAEEARGLPDDNTYWAARFAEEMTFLDVIEMVCDWYAAHKGYGESRPWKDSVEMNLKSKGKYLNEGQLWLARDVAAWLGGDRA
jgi:hypothetical protein